MTEGPVAGREKRPTATCSPQTWVKVCSFAPGPSCEVVVPAGPKARNMHTSETHFSEAGAGGSKSW
eukprot:14547858-Alexandrium_andersonii.AAC.1